MGRIALVTNSRDYGGPQVLPTLLASGWQVFCHDDAFVSNEVRSQFERDFVGAIAAKSTDVAEFVADGIERFGRIDALISNDIPKPFTDAFKPGYIQTDSLADFESQTDSLLLEPVRTLRAALPTMKAARSGSIVFITSGAPLRSPPVAGWPHGYLSARAAVHALGKGLSVELAPFNIQVNMVAPFGVYSPTFYPSSIGIDDPQYAEAVKGFTPMGRFGRPEELGELVGFLVSGKASFVSGQIIGISGAAC